MTVDILAAIDLVLARLNGTEEAPGPVPGSAMEPEKVNVPGAWVDFTGRIDYTLGAAMVWLDVVVIAKANDRRTALGDLQTLLDAVVGELGVPDGDIRKQATALPDGPLTGFPSLVLPYLVA